LTSPSFTEDNENIKEPQWKQAHVKNHELARFPQEAKQSSGNLGLVKKPASVV